MSMADDALAPDRPGGSPAAGGQDQRQQRPDGTLPHATPRRGLDVD